MAGYEERFETIVRKLRDNGHKITPQRLALAKVLAKSEGHPSVEDIHVQLKEEFPTMSLATVYRNVVLMKSLGEVLELGFSDGSNRYDGTSPIPSTCHLHKMQEDNRSRLGRSGWIEERGRTGDGF